MRKQRVLCFFLLGISVSGGNANVAEKNRELGEVQSNINAVQQDMQRIQLEQKTLNIQLAEIEKSYGKTAALLKKLKQQIERQRLKLTHIGQEGHALQNQIANQREELAGQIKAAYAMGQKEKLKLLLNQRDPALASRMMIYYKYLNSARLAKLIDIEESLKHLSRLDKQKQDESRFLEQTLQQKEAEQSILDKAKFQRQELLTHLNKDLYATEQQLRQLNESETRLKSLIASLQLTPDNSELTVKQENELSPLKNDESWQREDFPQLKGKLPWPVSGKLAKKFGSARAEGNWDGVLIDALEGTEIHAVTTGEVVYAEWLRGYGMLMIIDHGKGYMTLYAFNQSLYKQVGEKVEAGEIIASVGQSGGRSQPGLYFGIRKQGKPVDPLEWCRQ
ncbi:Peptidase M23 [Candidatus Methylobacter favarea]|uniref:Peptidase M23 n=2 Tax=Candidatus Methylobacter favarea TaxID=2707345 RepID=A0A8S0WB03_9GAMM|nr:Peptidase M23 [Candidatus Methylobacter favarea]